MINDKIMKELNGIIDIAAKHDYMINSITFYNIFTSLPNNVKTPELLEEMEQYLIESNVTIISDGVEIDEENINISERIRPFDPNEIDITMRPMSLDSLIKRIKNKEVNLDTEFQRKSGLWSDVKKSQLIESLLLKIPLPAFYFDASDDDYWLIIDGLQRITAFREFVVDKTLSLSGMEFFDDLNGLTYDKLPRTFTRRIEETNLIVYTVNPGTPINVKYNIFKRINTGGLELTPQEIRHALYQGSASKLIRRLSKLDVFKMVTGYSIRSDRMMDQEFVLRFIAVCYYGINKYEGLPDEYLNNAMGYLNGLSEQKISRIEEQFIIIMKLSNNIFNQYAFRRMGFDGRKRPINKAIFEIWCKNLNDLNEDQQNKLLTEKTKLRKKFIELCDDYYFNQYLKASDKKSYFQRMQKVSDLIGGILND